MYRLPSVSGEQAVAAFEKLGFQVARVSGSHHIMKKPGHKFAISIPVHAGRSLKTGTLRSLIKAAGTTPEEFRRFL